jgi:hypothetical protein
LAEAVLQWDGKPLDQLSVNLVSLLGVRDVRTLRAWRSAPQRLWLASKVTRPAASGLFEWPGLEVMDLLHLQGPGVLRGVHRACTLTTLRAPHSLSEQDLLQIARSETLCELGAMSADLTRRAFGHLLDMPALIKLDVEGAHFSDAMARRLAQAGRITQLEAGNTALTGVGLRSLARMPTLRLLDIWANDVNTDDIACLRDLPALESLTVGEFTGHPRLDAQALVQHLLAMPALQRVWIDGVPKQPELMQQLTEKIEKVRWDGV